MLDEQQGKLLELARDILENELSPAEALIVIPGQASDRYAVCESNRRLTALKILQQPRLARRSPFEQEFKALSSEFRARPIMQVACVIFNSKAEALKWIERKHSPLGSAVWSNGARRRPSGATNS